MPKRLSYFPDENATSSYLATCKELLAKQMHTQTSQLTLTPGSTQSFFQAMAALTKPGDQILIEEPTYEPFLKSAAFLGLRILRFSRSAEFARDWPELKRKARRARLILLANPHCPTGWMYSAQQLAQIARIGPPVILDEVYLPVFTDGSATLFPKRKPHNVVALSGLSKTLGLSNLRIGWVSSSKPLARQIFRVGVQMHIEMPLPSLVAASEALKLWPQIVKRLHKLANDNRPVVQEFNQHHPGFLSHDGAQGHYVALRVPARFRDSEAFSRAMLRHSIFVRPCTPFEMKKHVRLHMLLEKDAFRRVFGKIASYY